METALVRPRTQASWLSSPAASRRAFNPGAAFLILPPDTYCWGWSRPEQLRSPGFLLLPRHIASENTRAPTAFAQTVGWGFHAGRGRLRKAGVLHRLTKHSAPKVRMSLRQAHQSAGVKQELQITPQSMEGLSLWVLKNTESWGEVTGMKLLLTI